MFVIRKGVFETNSSSVHSLILCSEEEKQKLNDGTLVIDYNTITEAPKDKFLKRALERLVNNENCWIEEEDKDLFDELVMDEKTPAEILNDDEIYTYNTYMRPQDYGMGYDYLERFEDCREFDGKTIYAFGCYGHD